MVEKKYMATGLTSIMQALMTWRRVLERVASISGTSLHSYWPAFAFCNVYSAVIFLRNTISSLGFFSVFNFCNRKSEASPMSMPFTLGAKLCPLLLELKLPAGHSQHQWLFFVLLIRLRGSFYVVLCVTVLIVIAVYEISFSCVSHQTACRASNSSQPSFKDLHMLFCLCLHLSRLPSFVFAIIWSAWCSTVGSCQGATSSLPL